MLNVSDLPTPAVLVDRDKLQQNITRMQALCATHGVELRPHIKTHKMVAVARLQLAAGAAGLTCAKLGEAEALLPSGVKSFFVAHSLVDPGQAKRVAALMERLDDFRVAATSLPQVDALSRLAAKTGRKMHVMLAVDTGLGREGARSVADAQAMAARIAQSTQLELRGFYTHEGQLYGIAPAEQAARLTVVLERLAAARDAIDRSLPLWPGCSVSAAWFAQSGRVQAVRPGAYVFGDIALCRITGAMPADAEALHVLARVVDRPEPGLALIDAGSKTFSSDRTPDGKHGIAADGRDLTVVRVNEEHGYVRGAAVDALQVGEVIRFTPAHVCPVVNLTDEVSVVAGGSVVDTWRVEARGRVR
jgi:D-serine deaminase-like pyridoxal phosphate-dependent protein